MTRSLALALALAVAAGLGCGMRDYQKAATQFGTSTSAGVAAARGVVADAHETCRIRAWLHTVEDRFQRPGFRRGTDPLEVSSGQPSERGGVLTWREHCALIVDYDRAIMGGLVALEAYAEALRGASAGDSVALDAGLTAALASDVNDLAQELGSSGFAKAKELAGPLTALANVVLDLVRTQQVREAVVAGEEPVATILQAIRSYLDASRLQLRDAQDLARGLVRSADQVIPVRDSGGAIPRDLPGQALALYEFSRVELARLETIQGRVGATGDLVQALELAHAQLVKGARSMVPDADVRSFVSAKAREIVKQVNILRSVGKE